MADYSPSDWHWIVGSDESRFWSSAAEGYVQMLPPEAGVTHIASEAELTDVLRGYGLPGPAPSAEDVNTERDRRISLPAAVTLSGIGAITIDMTAQSRANITGLATLAVIQQAAGVAGPIVTFRDAGNIDHELTAAQVIEMGVQAAQAVDAVYKASWAIKAMEPIPVDFRDEELWAP